MVHMAREDKVEPKETNRNSKWKRAGGVREGVVSTLATIRTKRRKTGKQNTLRARQRCPNSASGDEEDDLHVRFVYTPFLVFCFTFFISQKKLRPGPICCFRVEKTEEDDKPKSIKARSLEVAGSRPGFGQGFKSTISLVLESWQQLNFF
ncbi:hypothetical protein POUND7_002085 [Theobroma cacao]